MGNIVDISEIINNSKEKILELLSGYNLTDEHKSIINTYFSTCRGKPNIKLSDIEGLENVEILFDNLH